MAYWLFQSNPKYYRILDAIQDLEQMPWLVNRFANQMSVGDGVLIWISGQDSGIYAIAKILELPQAINNFPDEDYWLDQDRRSKDKNLNFAIIQFTNKLVNNPILRNQVKEDDILKELMVIRQPQSTNYAVTLGQWERVKQLINGIESIIPSRQSEEVDVEGNEEGDIVVEPQSVSLDKSDRSLSEYHKWYKKGRLIVDPEWQRQYVWDLKKASRLIESFLIGLPVPVIYLAFNEEGAREVIDGLQRLTSIFNFFDNEYELRGLEILRQFNGHKFNQLPQAYQNHLEDCTMRAFELPNDTDKNLKFLIFERLNTGGIVLNDMEIRNCLYRGQLNDLIRKLAESDEFLACVNQKNLDKRMKDRGLVLRYLAFLQMNYRNARKGMKNFLNEFLQTYRNPGADKLNEFRETFKKSMKAAYTIFGIQAFRLRTEKGSWSTQLNASIFQVLTVSFADYDLGALTRASDLIYEEYLDLISTDEKWVDCVKTSTGDIQRIDYSFSTWKQRLAEAMKVTDPNDSQRVFSRQLKEEIYRQDPTCKICNQRITLINDAALDHEKHYWRGGKTIPENARLVHRQCNLQREH